MNISDRDTENLYYNLYKNQIMLNIFLATHQFSPEELNELDKISSAEALNLLNKQFQRN